MEWERILRNAVKDGNIKEVYLSKIPLLKNCEYWKEVEPIGYVDHSMKFSHYKGMLVKYREKIYFVNSATMEALSEFIKWKVNKKINVV